MLAKILASRLSVRSHFVWGFASLATVIKAMRNSFASPQLDGSPSLERF